MPGYERENRDVLKRCLKTASDGVELQNQRPAMEGRCVLAPETGKARLPTEDRRTGGAARGWEAEDRNRCLDVMSARRVKYDCRYPGIVRCRSDGQQLSRDAHVVIDRQGTSGNISGPGLYKNDLTRKQNYNSKTADLTVALVPIIA